MREVLRWYGVLDNIKLSLLEVCDSDSQYDGFAFLKLISQTSELTLKVLVTTVDALGHF